MSKLSKLNNILKEVLKEMPELNINKILSTQEHQEALRYKLKKLLWDENIKDWDSVIQSKKLVLIDFFHKVFNIDISEIYEMEFPIHSVLDTFIVVPPQLDENTITNSFEKYFNFEIPYKERTTAIDKSKEQERPSGLYVIAYNEDQLLENSNNTKLLVTDAIIEGVNFASAKELLLISAFYRYTTGEFLPKNNWFASSSFYREETIEEKNYKYRELDRNYSFGARVFLFENYLSYFGFKNIVELNLLNKDNEFKRDRNSGFVKIIFNKD